MKKTCSRGHVFEKNSRCLTCPVCWPGQRKELLMHNDLPEGLSSPALRALDQAGIQSLARLAERTEAEIVELHGMGNKALGQLKAALRKLGLKFRKETR